MDIVSRLRARLVTDSETYRCGLCSKRLESDRLNCPACGSSEIVAE